MVDPTRTARLLLESSSRLAQASGAKAIMFYLDALPPLESLPRKSVLVIRNDEDRNGAERFAAQSVPVIQVPDVTLDRLGQVKLAAIIALSNRVLDLGDTVVFLTGPFHSIVDTLVVMTIGAEYELFDTTDQPSVDEHIKRAVFHRALGLALDIGQHGREGRHVGALLAIGDYRSVIEQSEQMILNPFKGYDEKQRNILDESMTETIKEFSSLDGAFIIRGNGVVETAGARLKASLSVGLPSGLGARHAAAAGITAITRSIAISVSTSDGTVRVWRAGKMVASFEPHQR